MDMMLGFVGQYISAAELGEKAVTVTIGRVALEKVEQLKEDGSTGGKLKDRIVVYFANSKSDRGWLLNRTNAEAINELWGRDTDDWIGHRITLHAQMVRVGPKSEPGIRVKGSPELGENRTFMLKLPRRRPQPYTLVPTGAQALADERKHKINESLIASGAMPAIIDEYHSNDSVGLE